MKILHIHPSMAGGGIEAMICALANEMSISQDVTVCSIFEPLDTDVFWYKLMPSVKKVSLGKTKRGFSIKTVIQVFNVIRKGHYDVVNIHGMLYNYLLAVLLLHNKVKLFYTVHSDAKMENTGWDMKLFPLKQLCFAKGWLHPITISNASQESFDNLYHVPSNLVFNGIPRPTLSDADPVKAYRLTNETKVFIHAGRISTPKNQLVLCKVFKRLIDEGHDVVLLVAGQKQMDDIFTSIEPYFSNRIVYLGERNDIPQLMACGDAMCLPSIWEGLPITLLEALSVGCVPICSNVGGIPNVIVSGVNGFLSDSSSEEDYYKTMKTFLALSNDEYLLIKDTCRNSFSEYDIVNTATSYINTYKSV